MKNRKNLAIVSLVLAILPVFVFIFDMPTLTSEMVFVLVGILVAIASIILGILGIKGSKEMSITAIVISAIAIVILFIILILLND